MLCQKCKKNEATVHYKKVVNGKLTEMYLCSECADGLGSFDFNFDSFLPNLFGHFIKPEIRPAVVCPKCKTPLSEISENGKMGCGECYVTYEEYLLPTLKRIHGSTKHTGKVPKRFSRGIKKDDELKSLKNQLDESIKSEEYENAAKIRDKIREIEGREGL